MRVMAKQTNVVFSVDKTRCVRHLFHSDVLPDEKYSELADEMYYDVKKMFGWLESPYTDGKYYFSEKGNRKIQKYIKHLKKLLKEYGVEIVKKTDIIPTEHIVYTDEHQYAVEWANV